MEFTIISYPGIFIGLLLSVIFGALLGVERNLAGKMAGMRTYALVSLGAAFFVAVSRLVILNMGSNAVGADPLRIASQIVVGVGFLGAGLVVFRGSHLTGITTAAGIWVAAAVGMACGFGFYALALFATGLAIFIFTVLWVVERDYIKEDLRRRIYPTKHKKKEEKEENNDEEEDDIQQGEEVVVETDVK